MKTPIIIDYYLEVNFRPEHYYQSVHNEKVLIERAAKEIEQKIHTHVLPYCDITGVHLRTRVKDICSFCRLDWETDKDGMPICCMDAMLEYLGSLSEEEKAKWCHVCFYIKEECTCESNV